MFSSGSLHSLSFFLGNPVGAFANPEIITLPTAIIEAKKDMLYFAVPQAAMAVASFCKQYEYVHCSRTP